MSAAVEYEPRKTDEGVFRRTESWLDARGKGAWIAAMVLGFILFWPVGLALLAYMIWSKRMFSCSARTGFPSDRMRSHMMRAKTFQRMHETHHAASAAMRPSGNAAFDEYKEATLKRLMDEQAQFETFLDRLRAAKDKREFDQFMEERAEAARDGFDTGKDEADPDATGASDTPDTPNTGKS